MLDFRVPLSALFEITYECNNKCVFCYNDKYRKIDQNEKNLITRERFFDITKKGFFQIVFSGGEPLLSNNIFTFAKICKEQNITTGLITNGTLINSKNIITLKELFDDIQVSIQGHTEYIHDYITQNIGSFNATINGIRLLLKNSISPNINLTLTKLNKDYISDIIKTLKNIGITKVSITRFCNSLLTFQENLELNRNDFLNAVSTFEQECYKNNINFNGIFSGIPLCIFNEKKNFQIRGCSCGHLWISITPTGNVKICPGISDILGNVDNILDIWSSGLKKWRSLESLPERCKKCKLKDACRGGCRASALNKFGKINALDPLLL